MPIRTDTHVERVLLNDPRGLETAIKEVCEIQSARSEARRLVAAFEAHGNVILIFQVAAK